MSLVFPGETVIARASDNILIGGTVTCNTTPSDTYTLADVIARDPGVRVLFGVKSVRITVTLPSPARGDILAWPWTNLDVETGSPSTGLTIENDSGLSESITPPTRQANGIPNTLIADLTALEPNAATRTSNVWRFRVQDNSVNLLLGGALSLFGPKRVLDPDLQWGFSVRKRHSASRVFNEYNSLYASNFQTAIRSVRWRARTQDLDGFEAWFDEMAGGTAPGLLWPQITGLDAYVGIFEDDFEAVNVEGTDYFDVSGVFMELSKGKPV